MAHALEKYLGEMILVYMDIAVKCEADLLLYRMHDDIVLCGSTAQCEKAWKSMQKFTKIMGLEFNEKKTGSVSLNGNDSKKTSLPGGNVTIDFLKIGTSDGSWTIDTAQVDGHIKQLKKQLDECKDILSFIRTYNSCIGRFFGHTFGTPGHCLGHAHVESILKIHARIQQELFGEGGLTAVLKTKLNDLARNNSSGLPHAFNTTDSFIYNPILLRGLGITNPFVPLLLVEPSLRETTPEQRIDDFLQQEKSAFKLGKRTFERESLSSKKKRRTEIYHGNNGHEQHEADIDLENFMTFEEYTQHRELTSCELSRLYDTLMTQPVVSNANLSSRVKLDLERLVEAGTKGVAPDDLTAEEKYTVQLFSDEMFGTFGTVGIVDRSLAPLGVMKAVMGQKTVWQMVL